MAEIAVITSRKTKLQQEAEEGSKNAGKVLELAGSPNKFLSTIQIGLTIFVLMEGVFGSRSITVFLSSLINKIPFLKSYSDTLSLAIVVASITFLSLIFGELVPKRIALNNPESIAKFIAWPMDALSAIAKPIVWLLSATTEWVLRLIPLKKNQEPTVSEEEIRLMIKQGEKAGVFESAEKDIVERTLLLSDKTVNTLMTPRKEIIWLNFDGSYDSIRHKIIKKTHSYYPVARKSLDSIIGVIRTKKVLTDYLNYNKIDLKKNLIKPLYIPESMDGLTVLEMFKKSLIHMALVVDEYGNIQGLVTLTDILETIVGDLPEIVAPVDKDIIKRDNGSYYINGQVSLDKFKEYFNIKKLPGDDSGMFHTIGGFVTDRIGRIPITGDAFRLENFKFEVLDMDGNRVDKIQVNIS